MSGNLLCQLQRETANEFTGMFFIRNYSNNVLQWCTQEFCSWGGGKVYQIQLTEGIRGR
jgi:hypothetical protein